MLQMLRRECGFVQWLQMGKVSASPAWAAPTQRLGSMKRNALTESMSLTHLCSQIAFFNEEGERTVESRGWATGLEWSHAGTGPTCSLSPQHFDLPVCFTCEDQRPLSKISGLILPGGTEKNAVTDDSVLLTASDLCAQLAWETPTLRLRSLRQTALTERAWVWPCFARRLPSLMNMTPLPLSRFSSPSCLRGRNGELTGWAIRLEWSHVGTGLTCFTLPAAILCAIVFYTWGSASLICNEWFDLFRRIRGECCHWWFHITDIFRFKCTACLGHAHTEATLTKTPLSLRLAWVSLCYCLWIAFFKEGGPTPPALLAAAEYETV